MPGGDVALRVDSTVHAVIGRRPVKIVHHVVFARPHQLHRTVNLLGDLSGFGGKVALIARRPKPPPM